VATLDNLVCIMSKIVYEYFLDDLQGASDSLLNVDGMTCYEGLSKEYLKAPGDPDSDVEDEEDVLKLLWTK
jgi:hypothetical protein